MAAGRYILTIMIMSSAVGKQTVVNISIENVIINRIVLVKGFLHRHIAYQGRLPIAVIQSITLPKVTIF